MDVNAILNESLKTFSRPAASKAAQFILMLSVIDRTILPRRITFANGRGHLRLLACDRKAHSSEAGQPAGSGVDLVLRMVRFCLEAHVLRYEVQAARPAAGAGFTISELVNLQRAPARTAGIPAEVAGFTFDEQGWPLVMPEGNSARSLVSAWLVYLWMQNWLKQREETLGDSVLLVTTEGRRSRELAFRFSPKSTETAKSTEIMSFVPGELGRLLAAWRLTAARQGGGKTGAASNPAHGVDALRQG